MPPRLHPGLTHHRTVRKFQTSGFSLVELLTVVGIIALLIGILLPTMGAARTEAKRGATRSFLASCERGLEIINTNLGQYPDSTRRGDPLRYDGGEKSNPKFISGAHWLARAMVGHDGQGIDYGGLGLTDASSNSIDMSCAYLPNARLAKRREVYVSKANFLSDDVACPPGPQHRARATDPSNCPAGHVRVPRAVLQGPAAGAVRGERKLFR